MPDGETADISCHNSISIFMNRSGTASIGNVTISPTRRISAITSHLKGCDIMPATPITCHVLDTTTGRPAPNLFVTLTHLSPQSAAASFTANTDADGRVKTWQTTVPGSSMQELFKTLPNDETTVWTLRFDTGAYFGEGKTFFPEVEIRFFVKGNGEHYHVPLLLGPFNYTTYRGSS